MTCSADVIVALDACFTQKRNKNANNPNSHDSHRSHRDTCFLSEAEVKAMEDYVAEARENGTAPSTGDADDAMEPGMGLPTSVLDDCHESFTAADEKREKASTQFFADTGIMSLICRHDRLLFAVNMTHRGERQHYALALLFRLCQQIPLIMTIGLLYDIACQLKRSFLKYGYLRQFFSRMTFAVSVFHAYGHQWSCQVIYHPCKCNSFGLLDGEGCERFWSAIHKLIPILHVSGVCHSFI